MTERIPIKEKLIFNKLEYFLKEFNTYLKLKIKNFDVMSDFSYKTNPMELQDLFVKQLALKTYYFSITERPS